MGNRKKEMRRRSFIINCAKGDYRRTRSQLVKLTPCESLEYCNREHPEQGGEESSSEVKKEEKVDHSEPEETIEATNPHRRTRIRRPPDFYRPEAKKRHS